MPTPTNRTPLRVARGTYSNLNSSIADIQEGEICYATDQDKLYVKEGAALVSTQADVAAKANIASPTFTGVPAAPTASSGTNTTQVATTAFVTAAAAAVSSASLNSDTATTWTKGQRGEVTTLTSGSAVTIDLNDSNNFTLTLDQNLTIANPTNLTAGQSGSIFLVQDGTGSRTAAWGSFWDFAGATAPTLSTGANSVDRVDYIVRSSTSIHTVFTAAYS